MERGKIVYLSGMKMNSESCKNVFACAELFLTQTGYVVLNPTGVLKDLDKLSYEQCLQIGYRLVDIADIIFMVSGWQKSRGANAELSYAKSLGKKVMYQDYYAPFRKVGESEEVGNSN